MELIWLAHSLLQFEAPLHYKMTPNLYIHNPNGAKRVCPHLLYHLT